MSTPKEKPAPDWEQAERLYRAGQLSLRMIGAACGMTDTAIRKKAKKEGWTRDLTEKVQQEVRKALVRADGSQKPPREPDPRTEKEIIEQAAASAVQVVREHRAMLTKAGTLAHRLFIQLEDATAHRDEIEDAIHAQINEELEGAESYEKQAIVARRKQMLAAVSLPGHASTLRDLSNAVKNFVTVERTAWGLDAEAKPDDDLSNLSDDALAAREAALTAALAKELGDGG